MKRIMLIVLFLLVSTSYATTWPKAVLDDLSHYDGQVVHCRIADINRNMKIKFKPECKDAVNWQCNKDLEIWIDKTQFRVTEIATFNYPIVDGDTRIRMSEGDILVRFEDRSGGEYYIDLQMDSIDWINNLEEAKAPMEFEVPDGDVFHAECGIFNPQKFGDGYEAW